MNFFRFILFCFFIGISIWVGAADTPIERVKEILKTAPEDTVKVTMLLTMSKNYAGSDPQEAIRYGLEAKALSEKLNYKSGLAYSLKNIGMAYYRQTKLIEALGYWNQSLKEFQQIGDKVGESNMLNNLGNIYFDETNDEKALDNYLKALKLAEEIGDTLRIASALGNVGIVYENKKSTYDKALQYFQDALAMGEKINDNSIIGNNLVNLGEVYFLKKDYKSALPYYEKALKYSEGTDVVPYILNDIGKLYTAAEDFKAAIENHQKAYDIAKKLDSNIDMTQSQLGLAQAYQKQKNINLALPAFREAETLATKIKAKTELKDAYNGLAQCYASLSDFSKAFKYQTLFSSIKDTIYNAAAEKKLESMEFQFNIQKKEGEISLLNKDKALQELDLKRQKVIKNVTIGGLSIVMLFLVVVFFQKKRITAEKQRSDELLLNILPSETAEELKATGTAKAKSFDQVTVMFTDFKNFTQASEKLSAEELVEEINHCYSEFDKIVTKYGIEKIKTIGDSYMCAGGLPVTNATHPVDVVAAGLEMQEFIIRHKQERIEKDEPFFDLRLGIHTGPVVAGIVGIKKFAYDIWGDTVNTASRMESSGQIAKVNISGTTYELIKDKFICTHRGKIEAKNKGVIDMYFVEGHKV